MQDDSGTKAGSSGRGLQAHLADQQGELRLGDGEESNRVAEDFSRLCLSLKNKEAFWIGDDVHIMVYKKGGKIRVVVTLKRGITVTRPYAKKD